MIVLDSDILTLIMHGTNEVLKRRMASIDTAELATTLVTRMEILEGRFATIRTAANEREIRVAMDRFRISRHLLDTFETLEITDLAAQNFERLRQQKRLKMRRPDMLIACIALAHDAILVTRNMVDYNRVAGLRVENWAD